MESIPYIIGESYISLVINNKAYNINKDHVNYDKIVDAIKECNWGAVGNLIDIPRTITTFSGGRITVQNGVVCYDNTPIHNVVTAKILKMVDEGFNVTSMIKFLENLLENPSHTAVEELYLFMESGEMPITEDGHFLAYKKVRSDYMDIFSGTIDNSVGATPSMPRNAVNDNRNQTCSNGLHFCSLKYLGSYSSYNGVTDKVMIVKINPKDVVSIPSDYNNTKGRCCFYEVVGEYINPNDLGERETDRTEAFTQSVYTDKDIAKHFRDGGDLDYVEEDDLDSDVPQTPEDRLEDLVETLGTVAELAKLEDELETIMDGSKAPVRDAAFRLCKQYHPDAEKVKYALSLWLKISKKQALHYYCEYRKTL